MLGIWSVTLLDGIPLVSRKQAVDAFETRSSSDSERNLGLSRSGFLDSGEKNRVAASTGQSVSSAT
jgi:hypothetical protein